MDKKAGSKPMREISARLEATGDFRVVRFGDDVLLAKPVEQWPRVDAALAWHSAGFPLRKAQQYVSLRQPFSINDVHAQDLLIDRRRVYRVLQDAGIPVPRHIVVNREGAPEPRWAILGEPPEPLDPAASSAAEKRQLGGFSSDGALSASGMSTAAGAGGGGPGGGTTRDDTEGGGMAGGAVSADSSMGGGAAGAAPATSSAAPSPSTLLDVPGGAFAHATTAAAAAAADTDPADASDPALAPPSPPPGYPDPPGFLESDDWVELDGVRIHKPFVEKPASGEDHNVYIYYPHSMGGGVKRLFRKVADCSAEYDRTHDGRVRRDGSYIIEEFLTTGGTDVKVYTVGPRYAHAEARKSPVVDGRVVRTPDGKEMRFPVLLSPQEKEIARTVCLAFGQRVVGFDLLRSESGVSYVCDVNGLSLVKSSKKYYDDAAGILRAMILSALAPARRMAMLAAAAGGHRAAGGRAARAGGVGAAAAAGPSPRLARRAAAGASSGAPGGAAMLAAAAAARAGLATPPPGSGIPNVASLEDLTADQVMASAAAAAAAAAASSSSFSGRGGSQLPLPPPAGGGRFASSSSRAAAASSAATPGGNTTPTPAPRDLELRCVLAVVRHGDRTPKQKLKMTVRQPALLALFEKHCDAKRKQAKLKSPGQLQELLDATRQLLSGLERRESKPGGPAVASPALSLATAASSAAAIAAASSSGAAGPPPAPSSAPASGGGGGQQLANAPSSSTTPPLLPLAATAATEQREADEREELREKLRIMRTVLEQGGQFSGVNRKAQLKPTAWAPAVGAQAGAGAAGSASSGGGANNGGGGGDASAAGGAGAAAAPAAAAADAADPSGKKEAAADGGGGPPPPPPPAATPQPRAASELQLVLKWGGVLTHAGRAQAEALGGAFRATMYPRAAGGGLLRLHSTYRHDFKIYSSDEGRVQMSAAAFTKALLDLEGASLTPVLVSLVKKDAYMLDAFGKGASEDILRAKDALYRALTWDSDRLASCCARPPAPPAALATPASHSPPASPRTLAAGGGGGGGSVSGSGAGGRAAGGGTAGGTLAAAAAVAAASAAVRQEQQQQQQQHAAAAGGMATGEFSFVVVWARASPSPLCVCVCVRVCVCLCAG
jgi:hypothetical protein